MGLVGLGTVMWNDLSCGVWKILAYFPLFFLAQSLSVCFAQTETKTTGSISGTVYDAAKGPKTGLEGSKVTLINPETGFRRSRLSGADGRYVFDLVPPYHNYSLTCEMAGYTNLSGGRKQIEVYIGTPTELKVPPFAMKRILSSGTPASSTGVSRQPETLFYENAVGGGQSSLRAEMDTTSRSPVVSDAGPPILRQAWDFTQLVAPEQLSEDSLGSTHGVADETQTAPTSSPTSQVPSSANSAVPPGNSVKLVNTNSATRSGVFSDSLIQALPLQGIRTFDALALLLPGVVYPPLTLSETPGPGIGPSLGTAGQLVVNGLRSRGNNFTVDGSDNNDEDIGVRRQGYISLVAQSIESIRQYQIATLLAEPQNGRNMGAQANAVSRSGSSGFHGTLYGFLSDRRFNARDFFDLDSKDLPASFPVLQSGKDSSPVYLDGKMLNQDNPVGHENPFTRFQSGAVFGGPIKKEETFFFGAFERQEIHASRESHFAVPTVAQRGLFDSGAEGLEKRFTLGNEQFRQVFYPTSGYGDSVFSLFPWPNDPLGPYGYNTRTEILGASGEGSILSLKIDHHFTKGNPTQDAAQDHLLTGRYNFSDDSTQLPVTGQAIFSSMRPQVRTQNLSLSLDSIFSNNISNQLRFSYGRTTLGFQDIPTGLTGKSFVRLDDPRDRQFLLSAPIIYNVTTTLRPGSATAYRSYDSLLHQGAVGLPTTNGTEAITGPIGQVSMSGFSPLGIDVLNFPQQRTNNTFQYADTFIYNSTRTHRLALGADVRRTQLNSFLDRNSRPQMVFSGAPNLDQSNGIPNNLLYVGTETELGQAGIERELTYRGTDFAAVGSPTGFSQVLAGPDGFGTIGLRYWQIDLFVTDQVRLRPNASLVLGLRYNLNTVPREVNHRIEDSFQSPEVKSLIELEPGLGTFLNNRTTIFPSDHNNVGPYLAFAWDPFDRGKTSVRAGFGIYYDQIPGAVISQSRNVFPNFLALNLGGYRLNSQDPPDFFRLAPVNPNRFATSGSLNNYDTGGEGGPDLVAFMVDTAERTNNGSGPAFVLPSASLETPYADHWAITLEQEIHRDLMMSLGYVGTRGLHQLRFATPNLGPNVFPVVLSVTSEAAGSEPIFKGTTVSPGTEVVNTGSSLQTNGRPFPLLGSFTSIESDASSSYHSLQAQLMKRFSRGVHFTVAYTWGHAIDEVSDLFDLAGAPAVPQNSYNLRAERGDAGFDVRHRVSCSFVWEFPVFKNRKWLGGWRASGIGSFQTGQPFTILAPYDVNLDGNLTDRLSSTAGFTQVDQHEERFAIPDALKLLAPLGKDGAVGRNTFRAPGIADIDLAVNKRFRFTENHNLDFRAEFFNLLNRTHFGMPVHQIDFPGFGYSVNTLVPARTIQFAIKYSF